MHKTRIELLSKLKKYVENEQNILHEYHSREDGCFCAVGFLMNETGCKIDEVFYEDYNDLSVMALPDEYTEELTEYFTESELMNLQLFNDQYSREDLIEVIDNMMNQEESE